GSCGDRGADAGKGGVGTAALGARPRRASLTGPFPYACRGYRTLIGWLLYGNLRSTLGVVRLTHLLGQLVPAHAIADSGPQLPSQRLRLGVDRPPELVQALHDHR